MKNIPIVYNLKDLKTIYDKESYGIKGMWAFHTKCHAGHIKCGEITKQNSDWMVGFHWTNFAAGIKTITGVTEEIDNPILQNDIAELKKLCDVIMIFVGDYHPYMEHYKYLKNEFDKQFPYNLLQEKKMLSNTLYGSLIYSVFIRIVIHEIYNIKLDLHTNCGKDLWRFIGYNDWCEKRFGIKMNLIEPVEDKLGNVVSGAKNALPKYLTQRINKKLLKPTFKTIEEVENNIKDIKNLHVGDFSSEYGWIQCKFFFNKHHKWTEGIKCQ
jgi:hypothetical protein